VRKAVQTPLRQIAENAGEDGAVIAGKILDRDEYNWCFDAQTGEYKDLVMASSNSGLNSTALSASATHQPTTRRLKMSRMT
jgi:chaperonin GroEL (HSP60 family)